MSNLICQNDSLPKSPNIFPVIFSAYMVVDISQLDKTKDTGPSFLTVCPSTDLYNFKMCRPAYCIDHIMVNVRANLFMF